MINTEEDEERLASLVAVSRVDHTWEVFTGEKPRTGEPEGRLSDHP